MKIAGELSAAEVDAALFSVHFWAGDTRNHKFLRNQTEDDARDTFDPACTDYIIPARWAFRSELSEELGDNRDHSRDCRPCFRTRR